MAPWKAVPVKQEELEDTTTSTRHVVKPPSAAAAARASGYGPTAKKAKKTTAKATAPGPRPPAVHSAEHQWQLKPSHVKDVAEQVGLSVSKVWPKTDTFGATSR